jgi:UDP-GlcNAc3NAcA epimerase
MKLVTIIGARPQFIKAATVSRAVAARGDVREIIVHTGQHYDVNMSDIFFEELAIPRPDHHLGIGGGTHGAMTGRQLEAIERVLLDEKPDMVLVYGDTNSTLAGALAAVKLHIPVAHVEAGLRSFNRRMPEEINRILTDHASDLLFAPTTTAMRNLATEGIPVERTHLVGDVMYDASLFYRDRARKPGWFDTLSVEPGTFVLATVHRAENTDDPERLTGILRGLAEADRPVILPLHPRTRQRIDALDLAALPGLHLVPPVGYLEMVWLERNCAIVATDSGGVQKEAYFHGKPCVTLRDETEWVELVEAGVNVLVGADADRISRAISTAKSLKTELELYGFGDSAELILSTFDKAKILSCEVES